MPIRLGRRVWGTGSGMKTGAFAAALGLIMAAPAESQGETASPQIVAALIKDLHAIADTDSESAGAAGTPDRVLVDCGLKILAAAANAGDANSRTILARAYANGAGFEADREQARSFYSLACEADQPVAYIYLGGSFGDDLDPASNAKLFEARLKSYQDSEPNSPNSR